MKLSDYLASFLKKNGIQHVFEVTGGAAVHMIHSLSDTPGIDYICVQHEQAGAMAAESYSRITKNLGCAMATSGPGMTNLLTGIGCAYFDSTPVIYITGQVNTNESRQGRKVRQIGFQETDIVDMVKPITKYAVQITMAEDIRYLLEKAVYIAKSGRPGPVLVDIPMNIQRAEVVVSKLRKFKLREVEIDTDSLSTLKKNIKEGIEILSKAERPVVIVGGAVRYADVVKGFNELVNIMGVPVVATWSGIDVIDHDNRLYIGQIGVYGGRAANFTVQNSDCILSIGSRLDTRITGARPETFGRAAKKIVVDIDRAELFKDRGLTPDVGICSDVRDFIPHLTDKIKKIQRGPSDNRLPKYNSWLKKALEWKTKYPVITSKHYQRKDFVDPYAFIDTLSKHLLKDAIVIVDTGGTLAYTVQGFHIKKGQRLYSAMGNSPMGYAFPASIGASFAKGKKEIICITGDGGFQMNIQELQTLKHYNLPIKVFVLNGKSYGMIVQFQRQYFNKKYIATIPETGYSAPDFVKVANAYGLKAEQIKTNNNLERKIKKVLNNKGSIICDVRIPRDAEVDTKTLYPNPIENLSPELPPDEFKKNMIIPSFLFGDMNKKKVLVTGATGFIGSNLVRKLIDLNYEVHISVRKTSNLWRLHNILSNIKCHEIDLRYQKQIKDKLFKIQPAGIFHLANINVYGGVESTLKSYVNTNLLATANLLEATKEIDYDFFVNSGSSSEYGDKTKPMKENDLCQPHTLYGVSKLASTIFAKSFAKKYIKPVTTLRIFSPYGPFNHPQRLISSTIIRLIRKQPLVFGSKDTVRDYIYISDVVSSYIKSMKKAKKIHGEIINIGYGQQRKTKDVVNLLLKIGGFKSKVIWNEKVTRSQESPKWQADINKAQEMLGWKPKTSFEQGLERTINWYKDHTEKYPIYG